MDITATTASTASAAPVPVFVINLERSVDRREFMRAQLDALGVTYHFFKGCDASRGELQGVSRYDEVQALRFSGHTLVPAEIGAYASHYQLWQRCVDLGEPIVIMEDDVIVEPGFAKVLGMVRKTVEKRGFVRLAALWKCRHDSVQSLTEGFSLVRYRKGPVGCQCYALSPTGAAALLAHATVWVDPVDRYVDRFWIHGLDSHAILPFQVALPPVELVSCVGPMRGGKISRVRHRLMRLRHRLARTLYNLRHRLHAGRTP